ncbi:MAG: TatD family hydrolase [Muribaculaceae bacterium]|nr:TatD family hydrolase [Muribaculaceae bacterium]
MIRCLDIHTHHPAPRPLAVVNADFMDFHPMEGQLYSVGIHPWTTIEEPTREMWETLESAASLPCVVAIGECGVDKVKGGLMFRQLLVMQRQIKLSEQLRKPLIIHDVKAHDIIVGLRRDMKPTQNWVVHGFRGKPTVAKMLTDAGIYLSFGEKFNPDALKITPRELILAETDESPLSIEAIIETLSINRGEIMMPVIEANTDRFLSPISHP